MRNFFKRFLRDERGQVSAEVLIIMAAVVAVALVLVTQLQDTAREGANVLKNESSRVFSEIKDIK